MPNVLRKIKINEIAFVDKGAGKGVKVRLYKRNPETEDPKMTIEKVQELLKAKKWDEAQKAMEAMKEESSKAMSLDDIMGALNPEMQQALSEILASMQPKPAEEPKQEEPKPEEPKPGEEPKANDEMDKVLKSLPEDLRESFKAFADKAEAAEKRAAEAEKAAQAETWKRRHNEMIEKLNKSTAYIPGDITKRAETLLAVEKADKEAAEELLKSLEAANEVIRKGNFTKQLGGRGTGNPGSAEERLQGIADDIYQKANGQLSKEQSFAKAFKQNRDIAAEMRRERKAGSIH